MKTLPCFSSFVFIACAMVARAVDAPAPEISISLRGVADATVEVGEPLRLVVRMRVPHGAKEAITLAPTSGTWADAVRVEIVPAAGGAAVAQAAVVGKPDTPSATLDQKQIAGGLWRISSEVMQHVAPGNYVVRSRLVIPSGSGWTGEAISSAVPLQVVAASSAADRMGQRTVNRAQDALLDGRVEEAASILDALLAKTPDDARMLTVRAEVALRAGNPMAALICLNRAAPKMTGGQPPLEREELLTRTMAAIHGTTAPAANPPQWSWPPAAVMEPTPAQKAILEKALATRAANKTSPGGPPVAPVPTVEPTAPAAPAATSAKPPVFSLPAQATPPPAPTGTVPTKVALPASGAVIPAKELDDAKLIADPAGQWARSATASSQYGASGYSAARATGAPNIPLGMAGDNQDAWCPAAKNDGTAWLELTFAKPVYATEIRVRQNNAPGAMAKIEALEPDGTAHVWWEGVDPLPKSDVREIVWFSVRVSKTSYLVTKIKITLNLAAVSGWKQIDAVQLVGTAK